MAQQDYDKLEFEYYTTERGLPDDFTSSIMQDQIGYIWIGSKNGLSRFDGFTFKNFEKNQAPLKLRSNRIVDIKEFGDSLTGIVTLYGAHVFNTYNYKSMFFHIPDTSSSSVYVNSVRGFEKLGDNYVFLSPGGFYEFNHAGKIIFEEKSLLKNKKKNLNRSPEGRLLKINSESLIHYSAEKGAELYHSAKKQKIQLPSPSVPAGVNAFARFSYAKTIRKKINDNEYLFVPFDRDSIYYLNISRNILSASPLPFFAEEELWIFNDKIYQLGTNEFVLTSRSGGFYSFKFSTEKKIIFSPRRHLPGINCTSILKDREGRLWISSVTGVYKQKNVNTHIKVFKIPVEKPDEEMLIVPYIYENNFFMSSTSLDFILLDLEKKEIMQKFRFFGSDPNWNTIGSIRNYYQDTLWISTEIGIMWFEMKNFSYGKVTLPGVLKNRPLYLGPATANGKAWLCPFYELPYVCYDIKKRTFEFYSDTSAVKPTFAGARGIINDKDQNTWFYGYGLSRWNYRLQKFDTLIKDFGKLGGFKQFFSSVRADDYGCLWITTPELGLVEYNTRTKKVKTYESINAASLDYVQATSPIIKDKLWLGLTNKLVCFDVKTKKGFVYSDIERLPHSASAPEGFIYDKKTNEFYAAGGGNTIVHFKNETPDNTRKHIIISALSYNETDLIYHPEDSIKLNYNQNSISVYFDVIDFNVKYPQRFKYRIDGDSIWRNLEQDQPVFLHNLQNGWHSINIRFDYDNDDGISKTLAIFIKPPFWKTTWFYLLLALFVSTTGYLAILTFIRRAKKDHEINFQLKEFEFKALHAQMNPHFIFNSLNSIKALILYNRNTEASQYLNKFSNLVRQNLDHSQKQFLTLNQNLEYISQYIEIEAIRFDDLNHTINIAPELDPHEIKIAPMLLQPLIENAIWHGLQSAKTIKVLTINFRTENGRVICEIEDNGIGINKALEKTKKNHTSIGIENIRQRIALLNEKYPMGYVLNIADRSDKNPSETGTIVTLSFNFF